MHCRTCQTPSQCKQYLFGPWQQHPLLAGSSCIPNTGQSKAGCLANLINISLRNYQISECWISSFHYEELSPLVFQPQGTWSTSDTWAASCKEQTWWYLIFLVTLVPATTGHMAPHLVPPHANPLVGENSSAWKWAEVYRDAEGKMQIYTNNFSHPWKAAATTHPWQLSLAFFFLFNPVIVYTEWCFRLSPLTLPHVSP